MGKTFGPTRDEVNEQFIILHNEKLPDLCRSASSVEATEWTTEVRFLAGGSEGIYFLFATAPRSVLGPTHPSTQ
jgi:hypothetical protein